LGACSVPRVNEIPELFRRITTGVYVIGAAHGGRRGAFTAAWVVQASYRPLLLAVSVNPQNAAHELLKASGGFAVSVLKRGQMELARRLGARSEPGQDKLAGVAWRPGYKGAPVLQEALACFDCEVASCVAAGDHELVVGRVIGGRILDAAAAPMTYADTGAMDGSGSLYPASF
jgi:flavin reductase (DIM6/NTAB) family NADH-FMN oxidoreductase RutF